MRKKTLKKQRKQRGGIWEYIKGYIDRRKEKKENADLLKNLTNPTPDNSNQVTDNTKKVIKIINKILVFYTLRRTYITEIIVQKFFYLCVYKKIPDIEPSSLEEISKFVTTIVSTFYSEADQNFFKERSEEYIDKCEKVRDSDKIFHDKFNKYSKAILKDEIDTRISRYGAELDGYGKKLRETKLINLFLKRINELNEEEYKTQDNLFFFRFWDICISETKRNISLIDHNFHDIFTYISLVLFLELFYEKSYEDDKQILDDRREFFSNKPITKNKGILKYIHNISTGEILIKEKDKNWVHQITTTTKYSNTSPISTSTPNTNQDSTITSSNKTPVSTSESNKTPVSTSESNTNQDLTSEYNTSPDSTSTPNTTTGSTTTSNNTKPDSTSESNTSPGSTTTNNIPQVQTKNTGSNIQSREEINILEVIKIINRILIYYTLKENFIHDLDVKSFLFNCSIGIPITYKDYKDNISKFVSDFCSNAYLPSDEMILNPKSIIKIDYDEFKNLLDLVRKKQQPYFRESIFKGKNITLQDNFYIVFIRCIERFQEEEGNNIFFKFWDDCISKTRANNLKDESFHYKFQCESFLYLNKIILEKEYLKNIPFEWKNVVLKFQKLFLNKECMQKIDELNQETSAGGTRKKRKNNRVRQSQVRKNMKPSQHKST
jgi:hypothetical protein